MANIIFGDYSPPQEEDDGLQDIIIGVFFDGTLNNETNSYLRKENDKRKAGLPYDKDAVKRYPTIQIDADSYENDYSNIARMYHFYENNGQKSIYIEGIGTLNGSRTDDTEGYLMGTGIAGIPVKVAKGCTAIAKKVKEVAKGKKKINLIIDVFGFSRGAAAARNFIFEITKQKSGKQPARGYLGKLIQNNNIEINKFQVRFVGLYDTVSSYGVNFNNDVEELGLDSISNHAVKNVIQFSAGHEWRTNFNLTNINSAGEKGKEFKLPGAHADIGGCYECGVFNQNHSPSVSPAKVINDQNEYKKLANEKRKPFINQGWYLDSQIKIGPHSNKYVNHIFLQGKRYIDNRYSFIPLHFMCKLAKEKSSIFNTNSLEQTYKIPQKAGESGTHILYYAKIQLEKYITETTNLSSNERKNVSYKKYLDFENEKKLINQYIHWSATGKTGHGARENGKRKIISG